MREWPDHLIILRSATFTKIRADFHDINDYSKGSDGDCFQYITKIKKYIAQNTLKLHTRPIEKKNIYISIMVSPP